MIHFIFRIQNPWFRHCEDFKSQDYLWHDRKLTTNKNFEIQISRFEARNLVDIRLDLRWWGSDHQGPEFEIEVLGFFFNVKIYDSRHWNYDANRWETLEDRPTEEESEKD